jgi:hypothetical protein
MLTVGALPRVGDKLEMMSEKYDFSDQVTTVAVKIAQNAAATEQIQASIRLKLMLRAVVLIVKTINKTPDLFSIKLSSLKSVANTKSYRGETTLAYVVMLLLEQKKEDILMFGRDLRRLNAASGCGFEHLDKLVADLGTQVSKFERIVGEIGPSAGGEGMKRFIMEVINVFILIVFEYVWCLFKVCISFFYCCCSILYFRSFLIYMTTQI